MPIDDVSKIHAMLKCVLTGSILLEFYLLLQDMLGKQCTMVHIYSTIVQTLIDAISENDASNYLFMVTQIHGAEIIIQGCN